MTTHFKGHILEQWSRLWSKALRGQLIWLQLNAFSQRANVGAGAAQRRQLEHSSCRATTRPPSPQLSPLNMGVFPSSWCNTATDRRARTPNVRWTDGDLRANAGVFLGDDNTTETHSWRSTRQPTCDQLRHWLGSIRRGHGYCGGTPCTAPLGTNNKKDTESHFRAEFPRYVG